MKSLLMRECSAILWSTNSSQNVGALSYSSTVEAISSNPSSSTSAPRKSSSEIFRGYFYFLAITKELYNLIKLFMIVFAIS